MDKIVYYGAYLFCILQIVATFFILKDAYGRDQFFALLLIIPPVFALRALANGPDREERQLMRQLHKAKLQQEIELLGKK